MISGLLLSLIAASGSWSAPIEMLSQKATTEQVRIVCLKAAEGDTAAEVECLTAIREQADHLLVDELDPDFKSTCLVIESLSQSDLVWTYLEWLQKHPEADAMPASTTINAALLEKHPCGWRQR